MSWLTCTTSSSCSGIPMGWGCAFGTALHCTASVSEDELHPSGPGLLSQLLQFSLSLTSPGGASLVTFVPPPWWPQASAPHPVWWLCSELSSSELLWSLECPGCTPAALCKSGASEPPTSPSAAAGFAAQAVPMLRNSG